MILSLGEEEFLSKLISKDHFNNNKLINMKLYKLKDAVLIEHQNELYKKEFGNWDDFINRKNLYQHLLNEVFSINICR